MKNSVLCFQRKENTLDVDQSGKYDIGISYSYDLEHIKK